MNDRLMRAVKALLDLEAEHDLAVFPSAWEFNAINFELDGEALFNELKAAYLDLEAARATASKELREVAEMFTPGIVWEDKGGYHSFDIPPSAD